ncbi:hypothetical protein TSUD_340390 [Trifolium subterraneum]|uniref:Uncharacterized protein n=1 Tax=Trifolium subterraneum TaxID=3900 RepID=A0A2Z6MN23_TRISU|nr:hypothetical protein TSUD_340390 [Trifolium subterraneum]
MVKGLYLIQMEHGKLISCMVVVVGLIRGGSGERIGGFASGLGKCSVLVAKLWGV